MAIYANHIATICRGKLQIYSLSEDGQRCLLLRTMTFTHSLAFASLAFTLPSSSASDNSFASDTPSELRICISGEDGLHLYCLPRQELVGDHPESEIPSGYLRYSYLIPDYHERKHTDLAIPCSPAFDATSTALTWLQGPSGGYGRQYSFCTLVEGLPSLVDSEQQAQQAIVYELEHPDMPVLYAEGVYHYDAGLGVAVFGNMFGELALFDLSGCGVGTLVGALQPLAYPPIVEATIMPKVCPMLRAVLPALICHHRLHSPPTSDFLSPIAGHTNRRRIASSEYLTTGNPAHFILKSYRLPGNTRASMAQKKVGGHIFRGPLE